MSRAEDRAHNQAHWEEMAPRWKAWWHRFGPPSQPVSDWLVKQARLASGSRVLDLATGIGEPALSFARALAGTGDVLGIDQSAQMIEFAREMAAAEGLSNVRFEVQDVEALELDEAPFDVIASRWGLMFCTDVAAALRRASDHLTPGGRLVAAVWSRAEEVPLLSLSGTVMQASLGLEIQRPGPGPFTLADPDAFAKMLGEGGFVAEGFEKVEVIMSCDSAQAYLDERAGISPPLEAALAGLSREQHARYLEALEEAMAPWRQGDGYLLVSQSLCVSAIKA